MRFTAFIQMGMLVVLPAVSPHCNFNTLKSTGGKKHITTVYKKVLEVHIEIIILANLPHPSSPGQTYQETADVSLGCPASLNLACIRGL